MADSNKNDKRPVYTNEESEKELTVDFFRFKEQKYKPVNYFETYPVLTIGFTLSFLAAVYRYKKYKRYKAQGRDVQNWIIMSRFAVQAPWTIVLSLAVVLSHMAQKEVEKGMTEEEIIYMKYGDLSPKKLPTLKNALKDRPIKQNPMVVINTNILAEVLEQKLTAKSLN